MTDADNLQTAIALLRRCKDAMTGSHGPCQNNSCRDCEAVWIATRDFLRQIESSKPATPAGSKVKAK